MNVQEEVTTVVGSDIKDLDYDSDEGGPDEWVLSYIIDNFYVTPIIKGKTFDMIKKENLPPLNANGLLNLMTAMNQKGQLNFSFRTQQNKNSMYFLFARKVENMLLIKNWKLILHNFDTNDLIDPCSFCACTPCLWKTFGSCMIELVRDHFDCTPTCRMSEEDKHHCRIFISYLSNRIRKGFTKYLLIMSTPKCVVDGAEDYYQQEQGNRNNIPNLRIHNEED